MFRKTLDRASAGDNVGLLLKGVGREEVQRGDLLSANEQTASGQDFSWKP